MTSCVSFAKSLRCEFVSKALRLFNSQRSGKFVVAQQSVQRAPDPSTGSGQALGSLATSQAVFYAFSFFTSDGVPPPAPARVTQTVRPHVVLSSVKTRHWLIMVLCLCSQSGFSCNRFFCAVVLYFCFWVYLSGFLIWLSCLSAGFAHWHLGSSCCFR